MRRLIVLPVVVLSMAMGYPTAEAKDTPPSSAATKPQDKTGPTDAEIDEAYRMNREYDAAKARAQGTQGPTDAEIDEAHRMNREFDAAKAARAQGTKGPTDAEIDEAHRMNREFDAAKAARAQEVVGKVESVSGDSLTIRLPSKLNRKMDRLKANAQSKITKDARPATLAELKEGDEVRVSYKIVGSERHLVDVNATSSSAPAPAKKAP